MKSRAEKNVLAAEKLIEEKSDEADAILKAAEDEDRDPTEAEESRIQEIAREVKSTREQREQYQAIVDTHREIRDTSVKMDEVTEVKVGETREPAPKSIGEQFVESAQYKELVENGLGGDWRMKSVELSTKATLLSTPGSALTPPSYTPGIVEQLFQPPTVADLMPSAQAQSSVIRYVQEQAGTAIVNAAATVSEGAAKPESRLAFEEVSDDVRKIATVLPVSDEMLSDASQIAGYINQRLSLFVKLEEDDQLLNGDGTAPNISGFLDRAINTYGRGTVDNNAEAIFKVANGTRGSSFLNPDAVVMNPANWQTTRLLQDDNGQFYGGGPFAIGPYGGPQGPISANQYSSDTIWGLRVLVTSAIAANTALVGAFGQASQLFRKGGLTVDSTNSHEDFFYRNLTAIRAEERLAMAVYRPSAFTKITGLN